MIQTAPDAVQHADAKVREFQMAVQQGQPAVLKMNEPELNAWLGANLAINRQGATADVRIPDAAASIPEKPRDEAEPTLQQVRSAVREVKIRLLEDSLSAYVAFDLYGKNLSLELEGRLAVQDGRLRLQPIAGKLGSLPLLAGMLDRAAHRIFDSPENREKFLLPPHIRDVRVDHGQLLVSTQRETPVEPW